MQRICIIVFAMIAVTLLTSCEPDPRRAADAYATRQESDVQAQAQRQAMDQSAGEHAYKMQRMAETGKMISAFMKITLTALSFTLFVALISLGLGSSFFFIGGGIAKAKLELSKPYQVRLDPVTRQFPLLITKVKEGQYSLSNPNTDSITMLYERNPADKLMIQAMCSIQHDGALAHEARMSHRPGEIASIESQKLQIIEVE
jgi:hypothetical protein